MSRISYKSRTTGKGFTRKLQKIPQGAGGPPNCWTGWNLVQRLASICEGACGRGPGGRAGRRSPPGKRNRERAARAGRASPTAARLVSGEGPPAGSQRGAPQPPPQPGTGRRKEVPDVCAAASRALSEARSRGAGPFPDLEKGSCSAVRTKSHFLPAKNF